MKAPRPKNTTEKDLQKAAAKYLASRRRMVRDIQFAHIPNEIRKRGKAAAFEIARKKMEGLTPGAPDLIVWCRGGRTVAMELKFGSRPQTDGQIEFERSLTALGHEYHLIKSKDPTEIAGLVEAILDGKDFEKTNT